MTHVSPSAIDLGGARALAWVDRDPAFDATFVLGTGELASPTPGNQNRLVAGTLHNTQPLAVTTNVATCTSGDDIRGVAVGDLRGDGSALVAYVSEDNDRVAVIAAGCPGGEVLVSTPSNGVPNGPGSIEIADMDQDGDRDLLISARFNDEAGTAGDLVGWYPNAGDATFGALQRLGVVDGAVDAVAVDIDRDGDIDVVSSAQGDPLLDANAGRVLLFRNLGASTFQTQPIATGIHAPARASFADLDHDGDVDVLVPSASERARPPSRTQCGLNLIEARGDGSYDPPRCLDLPSTSVVTHLAGPHSRLTLSDLDADGVMEIFATRIADQQLAAYDIDRPAQFLLRETSASGPLVIERSIETCYRSLDFTPLGRVGDAELEVDHVVLDLDTELLGDTIASAVLRRDDGDGVPEPAQDAVVAAPESDAKGLLDKQILLSRLPGALGARVAQGEQAQFWFCLQPGPQLTHRSGLLLPRASFADTQGVRVEGLRRGAAQPSARSATLFRHGFD
jgi:hypothetical protein